MSENHFEASDLNLLATLDAGNTWLRSALCTLARRGTQLRQQQPDRARAIIGALGPWPWFKAGQFVFDLMEWEDFMVDGPPPPPLNGLLTSANWAQIENLLTKIRALIHTVQGAGSPDEVTAEQFVAQLDDTHLPALEPGLHLYRDVVLGIWASAAALPVPPTIE